MRKLSSFSRLACSAALVLACGGDGPVGPPPPPPASSGIKVIAGAGAADTIGATLSQPLMVEIRDSAGVLVPGAVVRFTGVPVNNAAGSATVPALVAALTDNQFGSSAAPTTDGQGRAAVFVQLGLVAASARIEISVPAYGFVDTVSFTAQPGAAARLSFQPSDTGVTVGGAVQLRAAVVDRGGNPRPDPVSYDADPSSVGSVTSSGLLAGKSIGQVSVTAHSGPLSGAGAVEVVPRGTIAAYRAAASYTDSSGIVTFNLDGSGYQWLAKAQNTGFGTVQPTWTDTGAVVYAAGQGAAPNRLVSVSAGRAPVILNSAGTPGFGDEGYPQYNAATAKTFYSANEAAPTWRVWSRAADGTLTQIMAEPVGALEWRATPSPDGAKLAYVTNVALDIVMKVFDTATGSASSWTVSGQNPAWSPLGDRIAFIPPYGGAPLSLMNADGSNLHALSASRYSDEPVTWSPDGSWILAQEQETGSVIDLVNTSTGRVVPLKYLARYSNPAWKP